TARVRGGADGADEVARAVRRDAREERVDVVRGGRARRSEAVRHRLARDVTREHGDAIAAIHLLRDLHRETLRAGEALAEHRATRVDDDDLVARLRVGPLRELRA